jgi:four helix bundle protein
LSSEFETFCTADNHFSVEASGFARVGSFLWNPRICRTGSGVLLLQVDALPDTRTGRHVDGQLIRSGTAAGPNYDEGRVAESRADFSHKVNIALKELVETEGWLKFVSIHELLDETRLAAVRDECSQLCRILTASVATAKGRRRDVGQALSIGH